jgi:hypothetical protein
VANAHIRADGDQVIITINGNETRLPYDVALAISRALESVGRAAEEVACREQIIMDQAIVLRAGAPFGLTSHPALQAAAAREAAWNSTLRRQMPGGVRSAEQLGVPAVRRAPPRKKVL